MIRPVNPSTEDNLNSAPPSDVAKAILQVLVNQNEIPSLTGLIHFVQDCWGKNNDLWAPSSQSPQWTSAQGFTIGNISTDMQTPPEDETMQDVVHGNVANKAVREEEMVQPLLLKTIF